MTTEREMKKSSSESPPLSFSSLPYDVILNCLARVSRIHYPTLSLVSKDLRSLITSTELDTTRSNIGKTESFSYVCLDINKNSPNPSWFTLSPNPKQHLKFQPITSFPYAHPKSSTVCSFGSEIYLIGGFINETRSNRVFILDCRCHQWRRLPEMRLSRVNAAADVIDGNLYVIGGSESNNIEDWGEVYDLKTQTWKPLLPRALDHTNHMRVVQGSLVMSGKVYDMDGLELELKKNLLLVEIKMNMLCLISVSHGNLIWRDPDEGSKWRNVKLIWRDQNKNLESPYSYFRNRRVFVTNSGGGRRSVMLWWKTSVYVRRGGWEIPKTAISCAEVSFERRSLRELGGFVEWCKNVFLLEGWDSDPDFFLHSAFVTH
ncbi:putative F-box/kelch-repeat protein [Cardamine amara subsp. amara]|uniref:F-box/kelch-repeat protein n=1 Tax=Cardamine amara subsp. amara TaxID=228776 RepID=A0ABD1BVP9_CARAN